MSLWDSTPIYGDDSVLPPSDYAGMLPRDYDKDPWGGLGFAAPWTRETIPRSEWGSIAEKKKRQRTRLIDMLLDCGWKPTHQSQTNWCWAHAVTMACEIMDVVQKGKWERLSPASLAWPIVGGNHGGYVTEALKYVAKHGVATAATWDLNSMSQRQDTAESLASRQRNRVDHWWDLQPRSIDQLVTCLLSDDPVPVACGFNWMRHAIVAVEVSFPSGVSDFLYGNSGLYRDANGYTRLTGSKAIPDSMIAPTLVTGE